MLLPAKTFNYLIPASERNSYIYNCYVNLPSAIQRYMKRKHLNINMVPFTCSRFSFTWQVIICLIIVMLPACGYVSSTNNAPKTVHRDTSVTASNAFINTFLDSTEVSKFLSGAGLSTQDSTQISNFYKNRNYEFAWFDSAGLTDHATSFISLYRNYRSTTGDASLQNKALDVTLDSLMDDSSFVIEHASVIPGTELALTRQFFIYSHKAYAGSFVNPEDLGWFIPKKKIDIKSFLDSVVLNRDKKISDFEPVSPMFSPLHDYLEKYSAIEKNNDWPVIDFTKNQYKTGDVAPEIALMKKKLQLVEDLPASDTGELFTEATKKGVISYQHRYGFKEDGIVNKKMMAELNKPVTDRIKQLMVNIERIKWISRPGNGRYIVVNIPAFKLYAFDSGKLQFSMKTVVGSQAHNTVVFSDVVEIIAFSPYWNVPYSIVKNEMAGKSGAYFSRNHYEITGRYSDGRPQVRQKPGPWNALGGVKFLFPNSYSIYMHDTPSKGLFNRDYRAFSHGCIRLSDPEKLAAWLLDYDPAWTKDSIQKAMQLPAEKQVRLKRTVPVFIGYFTAWVEKDGKLNFRDDLYGHDQQMIEKLFSSN